MLRPVVSRLIRLVLVLLLVAVATLLLLDLLPGDPARTALGDSATPQQIAVLNHQMKLDQPFLSRLGNWMGGLAHGDLGTSLTARQPVWSEIRAGLPVTLELAIAALLIGLLVAVPVAVYAANHPNGWLDRVVTAAASVLLSVPGFLMAVLLVYFFAVSKHWLPVTGWVPLTASLSDNVRHAALPILTLALHMSATFARVLRNDMVSTLQEDYVLAAKARGLSTGRVLFRHALRPSVLPLVTVAGVQLGYLIGGTVIVESVFALPGIGQLTIQAINSRDYTVIQGVVMLVAVIYVGINILVDVSYPFLDPRVRVRS
jgi:peptide/nickel transport system permease protein